MRKKKLLKHCAFCNAVFETHSNLKEHQTLCRLRQKITPFKGKIARDEEGRIILQSYDAHDPRLAQYAHSPE